MQNKVVIITGGSSGIGKALAFAFGKEGAKVIITGRNIDSLQSTSQALSQQNIEHLALQADASIETDAQKVIEKTIEKYGKIDILINNAGVSMWASFEEVDLKVIHELMQINFFGAVYATKYALPYIIQNQGSIVGVSSIAGFRGLPGLTGYSASKFAMNGFLEALRTELIPKKVHILTVCPGYTESNIRKTALIKDGTRQGETDRDNRKMMSAEEVALKILKAIRKRKRSLLLTRQVKLANFMNKWFPAFVDKQVYKVMTKEANASF
jgi:dehydrogenase/reductase SDR family member 7B